MLDKADLKAGNDLILRTTDGKLFQQSICLQKKQPDSTLLEKIVGLTMIGEGSLADANGQCRLK